MTVLSPTARCGAEGGAGTEGSEQLGKLFTAMNTAGSGELSLAVGVPTIQISRRYYIHPQVNVLTTHV